jgi:IS5 family transposase
MKKVFKRHRDYGFFDQDIRLSKLTKLGDPLEKLNQGIDFEVFRSFLELKLSPLAKAKGGRPPYDYVVMFKILILQRYYNLSDDQTEYQINDRMSFLRFLNFTISDDIPDSKTIWNFREKLTNLELVEPIFNIFLAELEKLNLVVNEGKIVDASFIEMPKQRNSKETNEVIKSGKIPQKFLDQPNKLAQKDTDARWTKKNNQNYYGYKNHIKTDSKSKIVIKYVVTDASVHDSQVIDNLLDEKDAKQDFYADSAYAGEKQEEIINKKSMNNKVCERAYRNTPLNDEQKASNTEKSRVRSTVEHVFGFMEGSMNGMGLQCVGIKRVKSIVGLMNLTYNMFRKIQLKTA